MTLYNMHTTLDGRYNFIHTGSPFTIYVEEEEHISKTFETVVTSSTVTHPLTLNMESQFLCIDHSQWFVLETYGGDVDAQNLLITIGGPKLAHLHDRCSYG